METALAVYDLAGMTRSLLTDQSINQLIIHVFYCTTTDNNVKNKTQSSCCTTSFMFCSLLWPRYGIGQTIIFSSCRLFFFFFFFLFFLAYSQPSQIGCLPYFHTWYGLSANLRCRSETYCTGLAESTGRKNSPKIPIWAPSHNFVGLYLCN